MTNLINKVRTGLTFIKKYDILLRNMFINTFTPRFLPTIIQYPSKVNR